MLLGLPQTLKLHGQLALPHFILGERLQVGREAELVADPDEPLCRVVLVPLDCVAVIYRELVVEIVIPLSVRNERSNHMVTGRVLVVKWRLPKPVRKGVDAEGRL